MYSVREITTQERQQKCQLERQYVDNVNDFNLAYRFFTFITPESYIDNLLFEKKFNAIYLLL